MKVLFATSEAYPFAMSGGLADVSGALPKALRMRLVGARVIMPLYDTVPQELRDSMRFVTSISVPVAWRRQYCGIFEAKYNGIIYYLIDNLYYFGNREGLLPDAPGRTWTECDINTLGASGRGAERIVFSNDGLIYYTPDHYESFTLLYGQP